MRYGKYGRWCLEAIAGLLLGLAPQWTLRRVLLGDGPDAQSLADPARWHLYWLTLGLAVLLIVVLARRRPALACGFFGGTLPLAVVNLSVLLPPGSLARC